MIENILIFFKEKNTQIPKRSVAPSGGQGVKRPPTLLLMANKYLV